MAVTQAPVDEGEKFAGGSDFGDVGAASFFEPGPVLAEPAVGAEPLHGFHRGPAHQPVALLGDTSAVDFGVRFAVLGGQPSPGAQLVRAGESRDIADLCSEYGRQGGADPVDGLDRLEPRNLREPDPDDFRYGVDLLVLQGDQAA